MALYFSNIGTFCRPSTQKTENKNQENLRVGYVCIEESFDTNFNMGYMYNHGLTYTTYTIILYCVIDPKSLDMKNPESAIE